MAKKGKLNYLTKDVPRSLQENLEILRHTSVLVEIEFVKRYNNSILLLMGLSRAERILLDYITEEMDDDNFIINSIHFRNKFNYLLKKIGQPVYATNTIQKCFTSLTYNHLLLPIKGGKGCYQVNPLFFFKGSEEDRQKLVRKNLEELNKTPINKLRHQLLSQPNKKQDPK